MIHFYDHLIVEINFRLETVISIHFLNMLFFLICLLSAVDSLVAVSQDREQISKAQVEFSMDLFHKIYKQGPLEDVFFSPYSIYSTLATMYVASDGETKKTIEKIMRFDPFDKPDRLYVMQTFFDTQPEAHAKAYEMMSSDRVYISPTILVERRMKAQFGGKLARFTTEFERGEEINKWVANRTKGMVKDLFKPLEYSGDPTVAFVNTAYFKGFWKHPFDEPYPIDHRFYYTNKTGCKLVAFMSAFNVNVRFVKDEELKAQIIDLPYQGDDISMLLVMPLYKDKEYMEAYPFGDVMNKFTSAKFHEVMSALQSTQECKGELHLPHFERDVKYELIKILESLGAGDISSPHSDFTKLFESGQNVSVSTIVHTSRIKVKKHGTEEAASTVMLKAGSPSIAQCPEYLQSWADHAFAYIIYDKKKRLIYFMGIMNQPQWTD